MAVNLFDRELIPSLQPRLGRSQRCPSPQSPACLWSERGTSILTHCRYKRL